MALPPVFAGAVKLTLAVVLPDVAAPIVGAPGTPAGVALLDAADGRLVPIALVSTTVMGSAVPLVRPVTISGDAAPVTVNPPGLDVTV